MKECPKCHGFGECLYPNPDNGKPFEADCDMCKGTGEVPETRADQIRILDDEGLGCFICEEFMHGACGDCRFLRHITEPVDRHICTLREWLKEKIDKE